MSKYPKISVITPSYNQGHFIEETITSVLGQFYPNLEYIVMDGGSTDNTVEILKKYSDKIHYWESNKDNGQADAINRGFAKASGDILCWLNSDDYYLPGTLHYISEKLNLNQAEIIIGNCFHFSENSSFSRGSDVVHDTNKHSIKLFDYIIQPSSFWTAKTWKEVGSLNPNLNYAFDWEWYIRAHNLGVKYIPTNKYLSGYRFHEAHKTGTGGDKRLVEIGEIYRKYSGIETQQLFQKMVDNTNRLHKVDKVLRGRILSRLRPHVKGWILTKKLRSDYQKVFDSMKIMLGL